MSRQIGKQTIKANLVSGTTLRWCKVEGCKTWSLTPPGGAWEKTGHCLAHRKGWK